MILEDFIVLTKNGLYCVYGDFYLDPQQPAKEAVISHAHADHALGGNYNVYCTSATSKFMQHRYKRFAAAHFHLKNYQETFKINDVQISFYPAGHMLGSSQVLMEYKGVRYLYTGDFKLEADASCEALAFVEADVLITETTFANPETIHPDAIEEIKKLSETNNNIMLGAYALGKSQRLIQLINQYCPEKRILVHHSVLPFVTLYEQLGVNLGKYEPYNRKVMKTEAAHIIYLVPPMVYHSYIKAINVIRVFVTGWKHLQSKNELQVYISDHADWNAIIALIENVKPKQVWTTHGSGLQLIEHYRDSLLVKALN